MSVVLKNDPQKEKGTVLLTTLLIMTVMAAITVALMEDIQLAVKRTINVQAYSQADWQADGAEDFVLAYLQNDFAALAPVTRIAFKSGHGIVERPHRLAGCRSAAIYGRR